MIIVVTNSKRGVGKSTLAVHLAAWLHENGHRVILADCDTPPSSAEWCNKAAPEIRTVRLDKCSDIIDQLPQLVTEADYVVVDSPGSNTDASWSVLLRADLAIVPCKASMLEVGALVEATSVLRQAQSVRQGLPRAIVVLSMVGKSYRLTNEMYKAASALGFPIADPALTLRQIYADAPGHGILVWNAKLGSRNAEREMTRLFPYLLPDGRRPRGRPRNYRRHTAFGAKPHGTNLKK